MRLLSCHIENFGIYSNETIDFKDGLNAFYKDNGSGKSTLVAFLYAMFYGFPTGGKNRLSDGIETRDFYKPWQGGIFGGKITFEIGGKKYTLQKTFGFKEAEDTTSFIETDTGLESQDYEGGKGKSIFLVDGDSFLRTVLATQNHVARDQYVSDGISARIGNVDNLADDVVNAEQADLAIKERLNFLSPKNKGVIKKNQTVIVELEQRIKDKGKINKNIEDLEKEIEDLKKQFSENTENEKYLNQELSRQARIRDLYKEKKAYENLCTEKEERKKQYDEVRKEFGENIPSAEFIDNSITKLTELKLRKERLVEKELKVEEISRLDYLSIKYGNLNLFPDGISDEEKARINRVFGDYSEYKTKYESKRIPEEEMRLLEEGKKRFDELGIMKETIYDCQARWNSIKDNRQKLSSIAADLKHKNEVVEESKNGKSTSQMILMIAMSLFVIMGIILSITKILSIGIVFIAVGLGGVLFSFILLKKKNKEISENIRVAKEAEQIIQGEYDKLQNQIKNDSDIVRSFLNTNGYYHEEIRYDTDFLDLLTVYSDYETRKRRYADMAETNEIESNLNQKKKDILDFFEKYDSDGNPSEEYWTRKDKIYQETKDFCDLSKKRNEYELEKMEILEEDKKLEEDFSAYRIKISEMDLTSLRNMSINRVSLEQTNAELKRAENNLWGFEKSHENMEAIKEFDISNISEEELSENGISLLTERLSEISKRIKNNMDTIRDREDRVEKEKQKLNDIFEDENHLQQLRVENDNAKEESDILEIARDYLKKAKENFQNQYRKPVQEAFEKYYRLLNENAKDAFPKNSNLMLDANFQFKIEEKGQGRAPKSFSAGIKDYYGICMRLAMVDAMYVDEEKPFLILDDPFVNYDDKKLSGAMNLVKKLSEDYQVIYFTCRQETMPK